MPHNLITDNTQKAKALTNSLEMRIKIKKRLGGAELRDPGENTRGIKVVIKMGFEVESHAMSKAASERRNKNTRVEPHSEPPIMVLLKWVPPVT